MGKPVIGEVVVLPFPQTDLQVGKRRPALVVADLAGDDLILCQITTQSRRDSYSVAPLRGTRPNEMVPVNSHRRFFMWSVPPRAYASDATALAASWSRAVSVALVRPSAEMA
jgi:hypothetical protein